MIPDCAQVPIHAPHPDASYPKKAQIYLRILYVDVFFLKYAFQADAKTNSLMV